MTKAQRSFTILLVLSIAMNVLVFLSAANAVNRIQGDFCTFATQVTAGAHKLPQVAGRVEAEAAYTRLQGQLGC